MQDNSQYYILDGAGDKTGFKMFIYTLRVEHKFLFETDNGYKYNTYSPLGNSGEGKTEEEAFEDFKNKYFLTLKELQAFGERLKENDFKETYVEMECY